MTESTIQADDSIFLIEESVKRDSRLNEITKRFQAQKAIEDMSKNQKNNKENYHEESRTYKTKYLNLDDDGKSIIDLNIKSLKTNSFETKKNMYGSEPQQSHTIEGNKSRSLYNGKKTKDMTENIGNSVDLQGIKNYLKKNRVFRTDSVSSPISYQEKSNGAYEIKNLTTKKIYNHDQMPLDSNSSNNSNTSKDTKFINNHLKNISRFGNSRVNFHLKNI